MTATYGASGIVTQTYDEARAAIAAKFAAAFGAINTDTSSVFGQLINILAELDTAQQQAILYAWQSMDPLSAQGVALDHIAGITGTVRKPGQPSRVEVTFDAANPGMLVPAGTQILQTATGKTWTTLALANLLSPTVEADCDEDGSIAAPAGSAWSLVVANPDVAGVSNALDATLGTLGERDPALRQRRLTELFAPSQGPLRSIAGRVSRLASVKSVRAYHNPATQPVDAYGVPFKAFEVVVEPQTTFAPADLVDIATAIWGAMGAGGESYGSTTQTITDSEGVTQSIKFSVTSTLSVAVRVTLTATGAESSTQTQAQAQAILQPLFAAKAPVFEQPGRDLTELDILQIVSGAMASGALTGFVGASVDFALTTLGPWSPGPYTVDRDEVPGIQASNLIVVIA